MKGEIYRLQLLLKGGIPFRPGPVSFSNPFGFGPQNGFFLDQGAFPEGITLDRATGLIQGSPRSFGPYNFTIRFVDAIGVKATKSFEMRVVDILGTTGRIRVSSNGDGNERDDHITLREAVLLATGKLSQDALKKDPNLEDDLFVGEKRWISGELGAPFQNTIVFEDGMTIELTEGPLVFDTHASTLVMGEKRIRIKAETGPVFDFQGDRNTLQDIAFITVSSGSAIRISGQGNYIGEPFSLWQHPSLVIQGGGLGTGVEVTGKRNSLASFSIQGFGAGLLLKEGAAYNTINSMRCGKNRTGIELLGGASHNRIFDCLLGLEFAETDNHLPQALPNREHGLVLRGGAQFNLIEACGMAANGMNGILVDGELSDSNVFRGLQIGSAQEFRGVGGVVAANGGNGIEFANGASENVIEDCVLSENIGNGILLSGLQTDNNMIGGRNERPVEITQSSATGDAILIKEGASGNEVAVTIRKSGRGGVIMEGKETSDNRITCRKYSTVLGDFVVPSEVLNCSGAGIFIGGGATDTIVEEWTRVENCGSGIVIDGSGTKNNCVQEVVIKNSSTNGIQVSNRAQYNHLGPDLIVQSSGQNGVLITGAGTDFNWVGDSFKLSETPHGRYAVEITRGAKSNTVTRCSVFSYRLGGFALIGSGTTLNRIVENEIRNQVDSDSVESVPGILIESGASRNLILDNEIGSGNGDGIRINGPSSHGNIVNRNGVHGFTGDGILINDSPGNIIGSITGGGNNVDDNRGAGIRIRGTEAKGNRVMANNIGNTSFRPGNGSHGVVIEEGAEGNRIGGVRPVFRESTRPRRRLAADPEHRGAANVIVGNGGDGVHIDGARGSQVLGNIIGSKKIGFFLGNFGNQGAGIHVTGGAADVCIGNCVSLADRAIGYGNIVSHNHGAGILISGSATVGVSVRENNVYSNDGGPVIIEGDANGRIKLPELSIEPGSTAIRGMASRRGYIEIYSNEEGMEGTYHLTAVVGRGAFVIDRFEPRIRSQNALILQEELALPTGKVSLNFTDFQTGNSTAFIDLE